MEKWKVDKHGFNIVTVDEPATVALLQPHAHIKQRAKLIAAAPEVTEALQMVYNKLRFAGWSGTGKNESGDVTFTAADAKEIRAALKKAGIS